MKKLTMLILLTAFSPAILADNVIVTETKSWKSVPIVVDSDNQIYTVQGSVPDEGDYYYTYSGYRCFSQNRNIAGLDALVFHAKATGGSDIYCYPDN